MLCLNAGNVAKLVVGGILFHVSFANKRTHIIAQEFKAQ